MWYRRSSAGLCGREHHGGGLRRHRPFTDEASEQAAGQPDARGPLPPASDGCRRKYMPMGRGRRAPATSFGRGIRCCHRMAGRSSPRGRWDQSQPAATDRESQPVTGGTRAPSSSTSSSARSPRPAHLQARHPGDYLRENPEQQLATPPSARGRRRLRGRLARRLERLDLPAPPQGRRADDRARARLPRADRLERRALDQAARELSSPSPPTGPSS